MKLKDLLSKWENGYEKQFFDQDGKEYFAMLDEQEYVDETNFDDHWIGAKGFPCDYELTDKEIQEIENYYGCDISELDIDDIVDALFDEVGVWILWDATDEEDGEWDSNFYPDITNIDVISDSHYQEHIYVRSERFCKGKQFLCSGKPDKKYIQNHKTEEAINDQDSRHTIYAAQSLRDYINLNYVGQAYARFIQEHLNGNDSEYSDEYSNIVSDFFAAVNQYDQKFDKNSSPCTELNTYIERLKKCKDRFERLFRKILSKQ